MGTGTNFTYPIALQIDLPGLPYYCLRPAQKHGGSEWRPDVVPIEEKGEEQTRGGGVEQPEDPAFGWIVFWKMYITEPKKPKDLNSEIKAKTKNHAKPSIKPSGV